MGVPDSNPRFPPMGVPDSIPDSTSHGPAAPAPPAFESSAGGMAAGRPRDARIPTAPPNELRSGSAGPSRIRILRWRDGRRPSA